MRMQTKPANGEIHIWIANLQSDADTNFRMRDLLSQDEIQRADRFRFDVDRNRFTSTRAILRLILGRYLGRRAKDVEFVYGKSGKPALTDDHRGLQFNVSHSAEFALFAVVTGHSVGVDIERIRYDLDCLELASRFFSPEEIAALHSCSEDKRISAFFRCWSRKEAYIKALGEGLSIPLDQFSVSFLPGELPCVKRQPEWIVQEIPVHPQYAAAVVTDAPAGALTLFEFTANFSPESAEIA